MGKRTTRAKAWGSETVQGMGVRGKPREVARSQSVRCWSSRQRGWDVLRVVRRHGRALSRRSAESGGVKTSLLG